MMKFLFFGFSIFFSSLAIAQTTKKVLFIGNSYTDVNNLPLMVSKMAASTNDVLVYDSNLPGGSRFMNHASNATTLNKINSDNWDYVVLQAQSQETSLSESQMATEVYPYATSLSNAIRANNECSQPMFYMTWGKENGDAGNCPYLPWVCTYAGMDDVIRATYTTMSQQNQAELAPVGAVWRYIRANYPSIGLYSSDSSHPSLEGSYAAACTFYTMIYKKDPTLIAWNTALSESVANTIKTATKTIVYDAIASWDFTVNPSTANFSESILGGEVSFTNESAAFDSLFWDFGDGTTSTENNPIHIYNVSGIYTVSLTAFKCGKSQTMTRTVLINTDDLGLEISTAAKHVAVYPNPSSEKVTIKLNKSYSIINVEVLSVLGVSVIKKEIKESSLLDLDISLLNSGNYIIKIRADESFYSIKIIKQ